MSDGANFGITQDNGQHIVIYGHWAGHEMLSNFAKAIEAAYCAWDNPPYCNRIIIDQFTKDARYRELGWGVSIDQLHNNLHKVPVFDPDKGTVTLYDMEWDWDINAPVVFTMDAEAFIKRFKK